MDTTQDKVFMEADNFDNLHVDYFAKKMKVKLELARLKGWWGWWQSDQFSQEQLSDCFHAVVKKGDPIDIANYCMFLEQRDERVLPAQLANEQPDESTQPATIKVDLIALQMQADAWNTVVDALLKISPKLFHQPYTGEECVVKTIEGLSECNKKLEGELKFMHQNYSEQLSKAENEIAFLKNHISMLKDALHQERAKNYKRSV